MGIDSISLIIFCACIILFVWEAITNWDKEKDFKQFICLTLSIILLIAFIICAILNFISNIPQVIEIIVGIGGIISLFSPLYHGFKKSSVNDIK